MSRFLKRKLECFYCGCRSAQNYTHGLPEWHCKKCDAVNYLDKNGDITDPPVLQNPNHIRYAQPRPASPGVLTTEESIFCPTCIKNQHLLTQSLAEYYPSPDDPDYIKYEIEYPRYRRSLEERYPQICEKCEPRVRARIQQTGYAAKTDHLRRMMQQTKGAGGRHQVWGWKLAAVAVGGIAWHLSLLGQFSWHLLNAATTCHVEDGLQDAETTVSFINCLRQNLQNSHVPSTCSQVYSSGAGYMLYLGLVSVWWNPRLDKIVNPRPDRIIGMSEYYKLQIIFLVVRFAGWGVLVWNLSSDSDTQTAKGVHTFLLVFIILSVVISYRTVHVDTAPLVNFHNNPEPLTAQRPQQSPMDIPQQPLFSQRTASQVHNTRGSPHTLPFPIERLAPTPQQSYPPAGGPLTPPLDEDDSETMDWTPSQGFLRPPSSYRSSQAKPTAVQPSPFYGKLPPNPTSQNHRLRNAPNQPFPFKSSTPQPQKFFDRMLSPKNQDDFSDVGSEASPFRNAASSPQFAPPKFFPPSDHRDDTGLESIFSNVFTLGEEPAEIRAARQQEGESVQESKHSTASQSILTIFLALASMAWYRGYTEYTRLLPLIRLTSLGLAAVVAGRNLFRVIQTDKAFWCLSDMLLFGSELGLAIFLGGIARMNQSEPFLQDTTGSENLGLGLLVVMSVQEICTAINQFRNGLFWRSRHPALAPSPIPPSSPSATSSILPLLQEQPSHTRITSSFSPQIPTTTKHSPPPIHLSQSLHTARFRPSSLTPYTSSPSLNRSPTKNPPPFATGAPSPIPANVFVTPSDAYSTFGATPHASTFAQGGRRDSDISGLGGLNLGGSESTGGLGQ